MRKLANVYMTSMQHAAKHPARACTRHMPRSRVYLHVSQCYQASPAHCRHRACDQHTEGIETLILAAGIHEEMLKDVVRTRTYQQAIRGNAHQFEGKAVLDIGCGTGILSMFAAQAGARHVYAVDMSSIAKQAKQIVADNGFANDITVMQGKMEELQLPEKVCWAESLAACMVCRRRRVHGLQW